MRVRALSLTFLALLVPLAGCQDDLATPSVALKSDKGRGKGQEPPPPSPTPDPVDPTLPGFFLDGMRSPVRAAPTPEGRLLVSDAKHRMVLLVDPVSLQPDQAL